MIRYLAAGLKYAFGLHRPGRRLPARPDDLLLASYPGSGSTWLSLLIANLIHTDQTIDAGNLHKWVVDPSLSVKRDIDRAPKPRVINSHSSYDPRYRRVIYLARDPRELFLSAWRSHLLASEAGEDRSEAALLRFLDRFLTGHSDVHSGSWGENAGSWLGACAGKPGFLLVRYEDLLLDPGREMARMAKFSKWPATPERMTRAIRRSSGEPADGSGQIVRSGGAGSVDTWRSELPSAAVARIEAKFGSIMNSIGYAAASQKAGAAIETSLLQRLIRHELIRKTEGTHIERKPDVVSSDVPPLHNAMR